MIHANLREAGPHPQLDLRAADAVREWLVHVRRAERRMWRLDRAALVVFAVVLVAQLAAAAATPGTPAFDVVSYSIALLNAFLMRVVLRRAIPRRRLYRNVMRDAREARVAP